MVMKFIIGKLCHVYVLKDMSKDHIFRSENVIVLNHVKKEALIDRIDRMMTLIGTKSDKFKDEMARAIKYSKIFERSSRSSFASTDSEEMRIKRVVLFLQQQVDDHDYVDFSSLEKVALKKKIQAEEAAREAREEELLPWQLSLDDILEAPADDRTLLHSWDGLGCSGKTWMTRYLEQKYGDRVLVVDYSSSRHALLHVCENQENLNAMNESAIVIFDIPRSAKVDHEFYVAAEKVKDGIFMAPLKPVKGKTMQCKLDHAPHVLVFSNTQPTKADLENLTADRWSIMTIDPDTFEMVKDIQCDDFIDEIIEERYKTQRDAVDGIKSTPRSVDEEIGSVGKGAKRPAEKEGSHAPPAKKAKRVNGG
jgi:hypothetical protein